MFHEDDFRLHAAASLRLADQLATFRRLFKTPGGHLTSAGRAVVREGQRGGLSTGEIAQLVEVNPAVVRYHMRAVAAPQGTLFEAA